MKVKETLTQNMTFMAIMAALNGVAALIVSFYEPLALLFMLVLPILSLLVVLYCQNKYLIIYFVSTIVISFLTSLHNPYITLFYLVPALITGIVMGILIKKEANTSIVFTLTSIIQMVLGAVSIPLIKLLSDINMVELILNIFKLADHPGRSVIVSLFIFLISAGQTALTLIIIEDELAKLKIELNTNYLTLSPFFSLGLYLIATIILPFYAPVSYLLLIIAAYFGVISLINTFETPKLGKVFFFSGLAIMIICLIIGGVILDSLYVPFLFAIIFIPCDAYLIVKYIKART